MKRLTIPANFGRTTSPFHIYIGEPLNGNHPLRYQSAWLVSERGGEVPRVLMEGFDKLCHIALANAVSFEQIMIYVLETAQNPTANSSVSHVQSMLGEDDLKIALEIGERILSSIQKPVKKPETADLHASIQKAKEQLKNKANEHGLKKNENE